MIIKENHSLKTYNTFGLEVKAHYFAIAKSVSDLQQLIRKHTLDRDILILGGGSNMLLTKDVDQLVILNRIEGVEVIEEDEETAVVKVGGGENWHEFVLECVRRNLGGVENLSLIPGTVGAAPIQNIGAYGVELKDTFERLEAVHLKTGDLKVFEAEDCQFGYRDSIFKRELKGQYAIVTVYFRLQKKANVNVSYGAITNTLHELGVTQPNIQQVSDAVVAIRKSKLPDPKVLGNSGSFFKNPELPKAQFEELQVRFPKIVHYPLPNGKVKVPAGWLIEQCGWKGKRVGNTGAYEKQALVLVNYGDATGAEVWQLAQDIAASVKEKFGVEIVPEVNVL
jgi:UDP-N-acetylmuramate dehydrogenase